MLLPVFSHMFSTEVIDSSKKLRKSKIKKILKNQAVIYIDLNTEYNIWPTEKYIPLDSYKCDVAKQYFKNLLKENLLIRGTLNITIVIEFKNLLYVAYAYEFVNNMFRLSNMYFKDTIFDITKNKKLYLSILKIMESKECENITFDLRCIGRTNEFNSTYIGYPKTCLSCITSSKCITNDMQSNDTFAHSAKLLFNKNNYKISTNYPVVDYATKENLGATYNLTDDENRYFIILYKATFKDIINQISLNEYKNYSIDNFILNIYNTGWLPSYYNNYLEDFEDKLMFLEHCKKMNIKLTDE